MSEFYPNFKVFTNLQVVGVMGPALQAASPSLISSILQCVKKTDIPLSNQKAAIHAFRLMDITNEVHFFTLTLQCNMSVYVLQNVGLLVKNCGIIHKNISLHIV